MDAASVKSRRLTDVETGCIFAFVLPRSWVTAIVAFATLSGCLGAQAAGGSLAWLVGHEPIGKPVPHSLLQDQSVKVTFVYERLITFDAATGLKMVVSLREGPSPFGTPSRLPGRAPSSEWVCYTAWAPLNTGTFCQAAAELFARGPLAFSAGGVAGDSSVHGLADESVKRVTVTLESGKRVAVPLIDNAFLYRPPSSDMPMLVTAYDGAGAVVERKPV